MLTFCVSQPINDFYLQNSFIRYHVEVCSSRATLRPTKTKKKWMLLPKLGTWVGPMWEQVGNMPLVYIVYSCCTCHIPSHQLRKSLVKIYTKWWFHILNMDFEVIFVAHVSLVLAQTNHPNVGVGMCEDESWSLLGFEWAIARPTYYIKYCVKRHHVYLSCSIRNVNYCVVLLSLKVNLTLFVISCRNISTLYICSVANVVIYLCHAHTYWWE